MIRIGLIATLLVFFSSEQVFAQTSSNFIKRGSKQTISWDDMVGSVVEVDGLAWDAMEKGIGPHLVLPTNRANRVYLNNIELLKSDLNGRLVRVAGVLRKSRMEKAPYGHQGVAQSFDYFHIDAVAVTAIDKVVDTQMLPSKDDWIIAGLSAQAAGQLIRDRQLPAYGFALAAAKDSSTTHSFQVSESVVLSYRVLNGRVSSVSQVNINGQGRSDDEWVDLPGFRLPSLEK